MALRQHNGVPFDSETGEIITNSPTPYQLMPGLTDEERASLRHDIEKNGIRVPIDVDENDTILDGHHRAWIAAELGIDCPRRLVAGLNDEEKRAHAIAVNIMRRNLTREQRRELVARLRRDGMSVRAIADATGETKSTVDRDLATVPDGTVPERIVGKDGKSRPATSIQRLNEAAKKHPVEPPSFKSKAAVEARVAKAKEMAAEGYTSRQIAKAIGITVETMPDFRKRHGIEVPADAVIGTTARHDANRVVEQLVLAVAIPDTAIDLIDPSALDHDRIDEWVSSLSDSIRSLTTLRNLLKKELTR